jgi:hypothetical protein
LHGSESYRVPWLFDEESVDVLRFFAQLKCRLMPYLYAAAAEAHEAGIPVMRPMLLEFPDDPASDTLDRQYMLGPSLLVAPVMSYDGRVDYYLPAGRWVNFLSGEVVEGGRWQREQHVQRDARGRRSPGAVAGRTPAVAAAAGGHPNCRRHGRLQREHRARDADYAGSRRQPPGCYTPRVSAAQPRSNSNQVVIRRAAIHKIAALLFYSASPGHFCGQNGYPGQPIWNCQAKRYYCKDFWRKNVVEERYRKSIAIGMLRTSAHLSPQPE